MSVGTCVFIFLFDSIASKIQKQDFKKSISIGALKSSILVASLSRARFVFASSFDVIK